MNIEEFVKLDLNDAKTVAEAIQVIRANPNLVREKTKKGVTALHAAAYYGNFKLVLEISISLLLKKLSLNECDVEGNTPKDYAYSNGKKSIVNFFESQEMDLPKISSFVLHENYTEKVDVAGLQLDGQENDKIVHQDATVSGSEKEKKYNVELFATSQELPSKKEAESMLEGDKEDIHSDFETIDELSKEDTITASLQARLSMAQTQYNARNSFQGAITQGAGQLGEIIFTSVTENTKTLRDKMAPTGSLSFLNIGNYF